MTLNTSAREQLRTRAQAAISRPVPSHIRSGDVNAARAYKECAAQVASFVRTGHNAERARTSVSRLECMQGIAPGQWALLNGQSGAGML